MPSQTHVRREGRTQPTLVFAYVISAVLVHRALVDDGILEFRVNESRFLRVVILFGNPAFQYRTDISRQRNLLGNLNFLHFSSERKTDDVNPFTILWDIPVIFAIHYRVLDVIALNRRFKKFLDLRESTFFVVVSQMVLHSPEKKRPVSFP